MVNMMRDTFHDYHPIINLSYFVLVIGFAMFFSHPLAQVIALTASVCYAIQTEGKKSVLFTLRFCLPMLFMTAIINPAFNHAGATILCYLPTGNPLTLESMLYGFSAGAMLATVLLWFRSFHRVMTSDKFIYLFGRVIPAMSLVLSMTLRFIPKFKNQLEVVADAQRSVGKDVSSGSLWQRTKTAITILSITVTWALENAIESADSMKSRGYGLKGRSSFSIYQFDERDRYLALWLGFCSFYMLCGVLESAFGFRYFPSVRYASMNSGTIRFYLIYFAMCMTPVMLNASEAKKWKIVYSSM